MSDEKREVAAAAGVNAAVYQTSIAAPGADDGSQLHLSPPRRVLGPLVRQAYGLYKLLSAPREALQLRRAAPGTALARLLAEPGKKSALAAQPFICAEWSSALRLRRMIEHCAVIDQLGHPFDIAGDQYVEIVQFQLDEEQCRLMLDRPKWLSCDGMLCVSLWAGLDRVFSVSFSLSDTPTGRTAYIGGIQGHRSDDALDHNRALTKAAQGMRPRDLAFELFRMIIPRLGVTELKCVADAHRYQLTRRARMLIAVNDKVQLDYDDTWQSRGGVLGDDGFFVVPIAYARRDLAEIPAKKRGMYKRRYAMLDDLEQQIALALSQPSVIHTHAPRFLGLATGG